MSFSIDIKMTDNTDETKKETDEKIYIGLEMCGTEAEGFAKEECPVDTGRLRNSITHATVMEEVAEYIGTNVEYAKWVEYRDIDHKTGNAHFLRNAAANHSERYKQLMEMALKGGGGDK